MDMVRVHTSIHVTEAPRERSTQGQHACFQTQRYTVRNQNAIITTLGIKNLTLNQNVKSGT